MKKIRLGLFLMMSMAVFSAPNFVDVNKIRKSGNKIVADFDRGLVYFKKTDIEWLTTSYVYNTDNKDSKDVLNSYSDDVINTLESRLVERSETSKAYIEKYFNDSLETYYYLVVGKNPKVKNCYVVIVYSTNENYTDNLGSKANELLSEAESNLR